MLICSSGDGIEVQRLEECHAEELLGLAEGWEYKPQVNEWLFPGNSPDAARACGALARVPLENGSGEALLVGGRNRFWRYRAAPGRKRDEMGNANPGPGSVCGPPVGSALAVYRTKV